MTVIRGHGGGLLALLTLTVALLLGGSDLPPGLSIGARATEEEPFEACFIELAPRSDRNHTSTVLSRDCFKDPGAAADFAENLHSLDAVYVIFTVWEHSNFGGSSYEWYSTSGCDGDYGYDDFNGIGWNDRAGSARSTCGRTVNLWEHTYQTGVSLLIDGYHSSLGVMNDQSSSWDTAN